MILVIGGAYQGKLEYAKSQFPDVEWIDGRDCKEEDIFSCRGIHHFHIYIKRCMERYMELYMERKESVGEETRDAGNAEIADDITKITDDITKYAGQLTEELIMRNPQMVIVSDEIGYGIVPIDRFEREYRELTGRICTRLAREAKQVHRVICGIGTVIKG